jgi:hypothetical protein
MEFEKDIEQHLKTQIERLGGLTFKIGQNGLPDRMVLLPGGEVWFIELKRDKEKPNKLQDWVHRRMERLGHKVLILNSKGEVDRWILTQCMNTKDTVLLNS